MYLTFLYVISNEGVDTQSSYPFKGKVLHLCNNILYRMTSLRNYVINSNPVAIMTRRIVEQAFQELSSLPVAVNPT